MTDGAASEMPTSAGSARRAAIPTSTLCRVHPSFARFSRREQAWSRASRALPIGIASLELGGGRRTKEDTIDHAVGVVCSAKRGQTVEAGQILADVHARDEESASRAAERRRSRRTRSETEPPPVHGILLDVVA